MVREQTGMPDPCLSEFIIRWKPTVVTYEITSHNKHKPSTSQSVGNTLSFPSIIAANKFYNATPSAGRNSKSDKNKHQIK